MQMTTDLSFMEQLLEDDRTQFSVQDDKSAEWAARKISEAEAECDRLVKTAQEMIAYYQERVRAAEAACQSDVVFFTSHLKSYFDTVPHKTTPTRKQESYRLPGYVLKEKQQNPTYERNADALLAWAKETNPEAFVRIKEEPAWSEIKAACIDDGCALVYHETGEIVPGVTVERRPPVFTVEPVKGA